MSTAGLVLEFLKVLLTGPVIGGVVASVFMLMFRQPLRGLITRVASVKLPGGTELLAPQQPAEPASAVVPDVPASEAELPLLPAALSQSQLQAVRELLESERARAYLWEYRFLNLFLVPQTVRVLEWFGSLQTRITYGMYDTLWSSSIADPAQRSTILSVLESHHLVYRESELLGITDKGREYIEWKDKV